MHESKYKVSVIITTYNSESYIKKTFDLLINQSFSDFEIICVNDCSTDNTGLLLSCYDQMYDDVRVINNAENRGAGYSRNVGMNAARGEYIIFLDDDDVYNPEMLEKAYNAASQRQADILFFGSEEFDCVTQIQFKHSARIFTIFPDRLTFSAEDIDKDVLRVAQWRCWDRMFRRDYVIQTGITFQEMPSTNDFYFSAGTFLKCKKISYITDSLITYARNRSGSTTDSRNKTYVCSVLAVEKFKEFLYENNIYDKYRCDYINFVLSFFLWYIESIRGDNFLKLYNLLKECLIRLSITQDDIYNDSEKKFFHEIISLDGVSYLRLLKENFYQEKENLSKITSCLLAKLNIQ